MIILPSDEQYGNPVDNNDKIELAKILYELYESGYFGARGNESYQKYPGNYIAPHKQQNCYGHACFNLRNSQLNHEVATYCMYSYFSNIAHEPNNIALDRMIEFLRDVGLKIEECDPVKPLKDRKAWKVAAYFEKNHFSKDFHFLKEEVPYNPEAKLLGVWSSKEGFTSYYSNIHTKNLPEEYQAPVGGPTYYLEKVFCISNPNANENHPCVKGLEDRLPKQICQSELEPNTKLKYCLIEGKYEDNYINDYDPIMKLSRYC